MQTRAFVKKALHVLAPLMLALSAIGAAGSGTSEISNMSVQNDGTHTVIDITTKGDVRFMDFRLNDPPRIVVDCVGALNRLEKRTLAVDDMNVNEVRTSQYATSPTAVARVVIDLDGDAGYQISKSGDIFKVKIGKDIAAGRDAKAPTEEYLRSVWSGGSTAADAGESETSAAAETAMETTEDTPEAGAVTAEMENADPASDEATEPAAQNAPERTGEQQAADVEPVSTPTTTASPSSSKAEAKAEPAGEDSSTPTAKGTWNTPAWSTTSADRTGTTDTEDKEASKAAAAQSWSTPVASPSWTAPTPVTPATPGHATKTIRALDVQGADIRTVLRNLSEFASVNIVAGPDVEGEVYVHLKNVPWEEALETILRAHGYDYRDEYGILRVGNAENLRKEELEEQAAERKKEDLIPLSVRIVPVRFANAGEMARSLANIVSQRGMIDIDERSNSLIVTDIERKILEVEAMVARLDGKPKQVEIVAKLVDVDRSASRELGISWDLLNLNASGTNATGAIGVDAGIADAAGTVQFGTVQSWGQLLATLEFLEKTNKADIISNPRVTTLDNRQARIMVGQEIPLIVSDEAGNPITELVKIGIILQTVPHVNADNSITLDLFPEVSDLSSEATVQGGVIINSAQANTRVIVENGQTAVIGGLIKSTETQTEVGVPVLMDIPVLGYLFKSNSTTKRDRELIIFVTPTIVDEPSELMGDEG